jgi:hypothetical protein
MAYLPQYFGFDPIEESIHDFFRTFEIYCNVKNISLENRPTLLDSLIGEPAKLAYDQAIVNGAPNGIENPIIPAPPAPDAAAAAAALANNAIRNAYQNRYTNRKNWLINHFHGAEEQLAVREVMNNMFMATGESPKQFYIRISAQARKSGLPANAIDTIAEFTWMKGLPKDITIHVQSFPTQTLDNKVITANNYWKAHGGKPSPNYLRYMYQGSSSANNTYSEEEEFYQQPEPQMQQLAPRQQQFQQQQTNLRPLRNRNFLRPQPIPQPVAEIARPQRT